MVCQGPNPKLSRRQADKAFKEVWQLLQEKYKIVDYKKRDDTLISEVIDLPYLSQCFSKTLYRDQEKSKKQLRNVLREIFWQDACETF